METTPSFFPRVPVSDGNEIQFNILSELNCGLFLKDEGWSSPNLQRAPIPEGKISCYRFTAGIAAPKIYFHYVS